MKRSLFEHLPPEQRLAARILDTLDWNEGKLTKRKLERRLNAAKYTYWSKAWSMLLDKGCIRVTPMGRRQQLISLVEIPPELQARTIVKRAKRRRKPTPWFKERLPEFLRRDGYDQKAEAREEDGDSGRPRRYVDNDPLAR